MGRLFVRAILSSRSRFFVSILALSGAPRQLSQRESLNKKEADSHLPLFPCTYRFAFAVFFRMMSHEGI